MKKKFLIVISVLLLSTVAIGGYMYYAYFRPLPYPKYQGVLRYRECSPVELSLWCGRNYLETKDRRYYVSGGEDIRGYVNKEVELYGEITGQEYGSEVISVKRVWAQ